VDPPPLDAADEPTRLKSLCEGGNSGDASLEGSVAAAEKSASGCKATRRVEAKSRSVSVLTKENQ
jgi:hypothetical protein